MVIGAVERTLTAEEKDDEEFLSPEQDLELLGEELVTRSSIEIIGSHGFNTDSLFMCTGDAEDNSSFEIVLREEKLLLKEDETTMSHMQESVTIIDREEMDRLMGQE